MLTELLQWPVLMQLAGRFYILYQTAVSYRIVTKCFPITKLDAITRMFSAQFVCILNPFSYSSIYPNLSPHLQKIHRTYLP